MNRIYKIVWNAARGCYVVASEIARTHQGKKSLKASILAAFAMAAAGGAVAHAAVTVADTSKYGSTVVETAISGTDGKKYEIDNQQVSTDGTKALNRFNDFSLNQADIANLNLGKVDHQINVVNNKINIDGVVNAIKDGKIGGDVYFFSNKGIAVGATGVINVGRLTLGTNAMAGQVLFDGGYTAVAGNQTVHMDRSDFFGKSLAERAAALKNSAYWGLSTAEKNVAVDVKGTINVADSLLISNEYDINIGGNGAPGILRAGAVFNDPSSYQTADDYRNNLVNMSSITRATKASETADGIVLSAGEYVFTSSGSVESHGRQIVMESDHNLSLNHSAVLSDGGKIGISVKNSTADLQADPEDPEHGGMLIIKAANISSTSKSGDSGDIEVTSSRTAMGVARVAIDDSIIDAGNTGDVTIHATANTELYAWDIGDGAYAQIHMGKNGAARNTITGKNVEIAARASTTGKVGEASETDAEKEVSTVADDDGIVGTLKSFFTDTVANIRLIGSATEITASADVDIQKTDINALGTGDKAGDIRILSDARSAIQPLTIGVVGFGFNVGIGHVNSNVNVDDSNLYAKKDVAIDATGENKVSLKMPELNLLDEKVKGVSVNISWAELHSDVSAKVGEKAVISSEGNTSVNATSTRQLVSTVSNGGNTLSIAGSIGIADTHATAEMNGTVYAKGGVSVKAENTIDKENDLYTPDTVQAEVQSGDSKNKKLVDLGKDTASQLWTGIKQIFASKTEEKSTDGGSTEGEKTESEVTDKSKPWNKLGLTASTALLFSENDATASVNGKVRGLVDSETGKMVGSDTVGAKSLTVAAETIARTGNVATSAVGSQTQDDGTTQKKENAVSAAVAYTQQKNKAEAFISGDVKTVEDVSVTADMKIPYQNIWKNGTTSDKVLEGLQNVFLSTNLGLPDLVDSWTQTQGVAENASGAASISVVNYDNAAKAYIGKKDDKQTTSPKVEAGGDVNVKAKTDITTVNFAGSVADFFHENAANLFVSPSAEAFFKNQKDLFNKDNWTMSDAAKTGLGGAALAVRQQNSTEAYIDDGAAVTSGKDVTVDAETKATNIAISTAGGIAKSVAIDATVGVNRIDNDTKARIGSAVVTADKNATVSATDDSMDINLAGGFGISGSTGIGASVAYNHIMRDTEAAMNGTLTAGGNAEVKAENTGEIIAASIAGAVAYESKGSSATNAAGSSGFHTPEADTETPGDTARSSSSGDSGAAPAADGSLEEMTDQLAGEKTNISSSSDSAISKVAEKDSSMKGNADSAKGGLAAAANVSVNRIGDNAKASVGEAKGSRASVTADALKVTSTNDSAIKAISGALSLNLSSKQGTSIAGSFMYNSITGENEAYVENADLTLTGNEETKDGKDIDESLTVSATNKEEILNIAASGSGASKGTAVAGQISLNWVDDTTNAHVKDSIVKADEAVSVAASDEGKIGSYTGAVSFAGGEGTAVGAAIAVNLIQGDTDANMEGSTVKGTSASSGGSTSVTAEEKSAITSIVAAGAAGTGNIGVGFSGTGNWISTDTNAHVDNKEMDVAALTVDAGNHSSATLGVGALAIAKSAAGAAIAVMVNDSDVTAYAKSTDAKAGALTISADNAYNGSASDSDSDTTAKSVAVGVAGGTSQFAGSGSVTVNVISQDTDAYLGAGKYDIKNGDVTIDAKSTAKLFGLAGGVSIAAGSGVGAAVDVQKYTGHTYSSIADAVTLKNAGAVDVNATSAEKLTSIAATVGGGGDFGGAGAAGAHDIETDTKAFIGKEKDKGESSTTVEATKDVSIYAEDTTELITSAGAGGVGGTAGVGLTAAVEVVDKTVAAFVGDGVNVTAGTSGKEDVDSFRVKAKNTSDSKTYAYGLGAGGTAGVAGAASETFVTHETDAYVGKNATVKATKGATITADSSLTQSAQSGSVAAGGTAGVGLGNATVSFKGRTNAYTDEGASVDGGSKVALDATHATKVTYATVAGAASGTASLSGTVGVNVLDTETKAYISKGGKVSAGSAATTAEGISVTAKDTTTLKGGNGGTAIGAGGAGAGAAVGVTNIKKDTEAFVGGSAALETTGKTKLSAKNTENLTNFTIQGSGGLYAGLAGAVNVMNLTSVTKAYTGDGVTFNKDNGKGGDITVEADHTIEKMDSAVGGAAVGAGALGTAVDVGNVKTQTNAYLGNNNTVHTDGALSITAQDHMENISTNAVAAAVGGFGLSGSISVYNFGSTQSDSDKALLTGTTDTDGNSSDVNTWASQEINKSQTSKAFAAYDSDAMSGIKDKVATTYKSDAPNMGEKGTLAMVGDGTNVTAKSVTVKADDKLSVTNVTANASVGATAAGASVSVVNTDTLTQAKTGEASVITASGDVKVSASSNHQMKSTIVGASISGGFSLQGTEETWNDKSEVKAIAGKNSRITAGGKALVTSENTRGFDSLLTGASVALVGAANGAVITSHVTGSSEATVEDGAALASEDVLTVSADADTNLSAKAIGAAVGTYAGTGTGVVFDSGVTAKATVGKSAALSGKTLSITATNTPKLKAEATSVGVGIAGVGITEAVVKSTDKSLVTVGDNATLKATDALSVSAVMDTPSDSDYNMYAEATAGAGGVLAGAVALSKVDMNQETKVDIGSATITAKTAKLGATHEDAVNGKINSVGAGGYSGTGGETETNITSTVSTTIGAATIATDEETEITAENKTTRKDKSGDKTVESVGASLAGGNGVVNSTTITHETKVDIGAATIKANASALDEDEIAKGKTLYDKNAIAIDAHSEIISSDRSSLATGAVVGAAHIKNTQNVTANTTTTVGAATLLAGDTEAANGKGHEVSYSGSGASTYDGSYKGGSIAVGSRNDATIESNTIVDVYGAAGYAGSENNVTYNGHANTNFAATAETAKGDISAMAGRDREGNNGTISVTAHSDILNATAIPISIKKDPVATANSTAALDVQKGADIKSDRDIHLKANAGSITAIGSGEVKDWVNTLADAFGAEGSTLGKKVVNSSANVVMNGSADTGIHRQKSITIGGTDANGTWTTTVKSDGDISYTYGGSTVVGADLSARLADLRQKLADFGGDEAAKAAYEAEIQFLEEKMAAQGLGYFVTDGSNTYFVELPPSDTSELKTAKDTLSKANTSDSSIQAAYTATQDALTTQQTALGNLGTLAKDYSNKQTALSKAKETQDTKQTEKINASVKMKAAETALIQKIGDTGQTLEVYMEANPTDPDVLAYDSACKDYDAKKGAYELAEKAVMTAQDDVETSKTAYESAVKSYNKAYNDTISTNPADYGTTDVKTRNADIEKAMGSAEAENAKIQANREALANQIQATEAFFSTAVGGSEEAGEFVAKDGSKIIAVYIDGTAAKTDDNGNPINDGDRVPYYLLHKEVYTQVTHNVQIGDITAQLGDILFEGDNVSGSGTLTAGGDAKVTITNASPNNLKVGDVKVVGRLGTDGAGQGGTIYYNDVELKGDMKAAITKANKDKKSVDFKVTTRNDTDTPTVTIENTFRPSDYTQKEGKADVPLYAASTTSLTGYIYNPRGAVKVSSKDGDLYSDGTIYAGTVDMSIENGDFVQSYDTKKSIFSAGGDPLDDTGAKNSKLGSGILANGNIFISARYVNINSTIQSGVADYNITIPKNYSLYYVDGDQEITVTSADKVPAGRTVRVKGATGEGADKLSYDFETGRFVVDDIEVHGGKVSIVGTIINTTNDTSKAAIKALDGYGQIVIDNQSGKDIELRTLSTGEGTEGKIEITDLDRKTGQIISKTTYTRDNGVITRTVLGYNNGKPNETAEVSTGVTTYNPQQGSYYTLQTGTDYSFTATYELHQTKMDWWGIENKKPTGQDLLDRGGSITNYNRGDPRALNGGAIITDTDSLSGTTATTVDGVQTSTKDITNKKETVEFTQKSKRLWYAIGLAKKYDYKLVEKEYKTTLNQYSVKADYGIGIGFIGNETGGTLKVDGGSGNVIVNGTLSNGSGAATLSGASITQGTRGYIDAGSLTMNATTGSAGTADAAIRTSAETVSGSAKGDFAVTVVNHGVTAGAITSGGVASLTADGDISQTADTIVTANRVELTAGGAIGGDNAFVVKTTAQEGKDYGLKAAADGDISITNTGGDLYLDSVISRSGTVTLATNGSFVDNNYTDLNNEDAQQKLLAWANAAVLEGSGETTRKQKDQLIAKVKSKYNEFQALKAYVNEDGVYTLDESTKIAIASQGIDVDEYIAAKQARYDELKDTSVSTWTAADVTAYAESINTDGSDIYGNASVVKTMLTGDDFLTQDEKAEVLVGSAKSAKDLLVTFAPGSIKEGITDTKTTLKGTPHVQGTAITLTTTGTDSGHTDIGQKTNGMEIDLSDPSKLTRDQLLALASAERGDFSISGNTVTVSSVRPITAESTGALTAIASQGAIYLISEGDIASGSSFTAGGEVRLKASGTLDGITIGTGENQNLILESGSGAITNTTITGDGVLTVRAKDGVDLKKSDGDLIVNTIYASEGDVTIDLEGENGNNSLLAEERDEGEESSYVNIEGRNITITNVQDMKGQDSKTTLGLKAADYTNEENDVVHGILKANGTGDANISLFGENSSTESVVTFNNLTLTNKDTIAAGLYQATNTLAVNNLATISGGTFEGTNTNLTNNSQVHAALGTPTFNATETLTVVNSEVSEDANAPSIIGATLKGKTVAVRNAKNASMQGITFNAEENLHIENKGNLSGSTLEGSDIEVYNEELMEQVTRATTGKLTITNTKDGRMVGGTFTGGNLELQNYGTVSGGEYRATADNFEGASSALKVYNEGTILDGIFTADKGDMEIENKDGKIFSSTYTSTKGSLTVKDSSATEGVIEDSTITSYGKLTYTGTAHADLNGAILTSGADDVEVTSEGGVNISDATAEEGNITIDSKGADETVIGTATSGKDITIKSGGGVTATTITAGQKADLSAAGAMNVETLTAGTDAKMVADGNMIITSATAKKDLAITSNKGDITADTLTAEGGSATVKATKGAMTVGTLTAGKNADMTANGQISITTSAAAKDNLTITTNGAIEAEDATLTAEGGKATLKSTAGAMNVKELTAGTDVEMVADGNISITSATAKKDLKITSNKGDITAAALTAEGGSATVKATKGAMTVSTLTAGDGIEARANRNVSITTATATNDLTISSDSGDIKSTKALTATNGKAKLTATGGAVDVEKLTAGTDAEVTAEKDISIANAVAKDNLTVTSNKGNIEGETFTAESGNAKIKATKGTMEVKTLTAGKSAEAVSYGDMGITEASAGTDLKLTSNNGSITATTLEATNGKATISAAKGVEIKESLTTGGDSIVNAKGGELKAKLIEAGNNIEATAAGKTHITEGIATNNLTINTNTGDIEATTLTAKNGKATLKSTTGKVGVETVSAGTDVEATTDGDISITAGTATKDLKITSNKGNVDGNTLTATTGNAKLKATKGTMTVETLAAGNNIEATAGSHISVTKGTAKKDLSITSDNGNIESTTALTATTGNAKLKATKGTVTVETLEAGSNIEMTSAGKTHITEGIATNNLTINTNTGDIEATTLTAKNGKATLKSITGNVGVETVSAGTDVEAATDGDISITTAAATKDLKITSNKGNIEGKTLTATTGNAKLKATKGTVTVETLAAGNNIEATAGSDISITKGTANSDLTITSDNGNIEATTLTATNGKAKLKATKGAMKVETLTAGTDAEAEADGNISITTATAEDNLSFTTHHGNIEGTTFTAKSGNAKLKADSGIMKVTTLTAGKDAKAEGYGDITITDSKAGENLTVLSHNGSVDLTTAEATKGNADITAGQSVTIADLTAGAHTTVSALGGTLTADSIKANESATLYSKGFMDIENLETIRGNANLTTDDSMDVTNAQIGDVLTMKAAKNITVSQSNSVNKTIMNAGSSIMTKGENANISSDEIEMTAGESILITDRSPVEKFTSVDLGEAASVTTGSGDAGSLLNGEATGHDYDVTKKGSATLTARKGKADLTAKRLEVDTAIIGTEGTASPATLTMEVDNAAIDDLQSAADTLHVMIHGNTSENTHYAGLHNSTDGSAIVKDSHIDHLNFTGNNDIGTENSTFAGDSLIQTEKVLVSLWKNPGNTTAESIGKIFIHDYDIASSEYFTRIRNGLTVNGERFPYTADSVMKRSLYGDNYLGRDGKEKEDENTFYAKELRFGEVTDKEAYRVVE